MWALRRASLPLRKIGFNNVRVSCVKLMPTTTIVEEDEEAGISDSPQIMCTGFPTPNRCYHCWNRRELSSQAGSTKEEEEDEFLELGGENKKTLSSDTELSDDSEDDGEPNDEFESLDEEMGESTDKKKTRQGRFVSKMLPEILAAPGNSVCLALDKWFEQGNELNRDEISVTMPYLRKRKMYQRALQLSEWHESKKQLEFVERDHACRLDLIARLHGLQKAEAYIKTIPESFRGEVVYRTLLANCVARGNLKKSVEIFNKMKELDFPLTSFACNQLLLLHKKFDKKKIADVLLLMERENIEPSPLTYKILIDAKGQSNDIAGMDQIANTMKAKGIEMNTGIKGVLVRHYISAGLHDKAETLLKEIEGGNLEENWWVRQILMPFYAKLGKADEVERVWKACAACPSLRECLSAIEAWGMLKKIDEAEAAFEIMSRKWKLSSKSCSVLLTVYANNNMLIKGKDLIKRMTNSGCQMGPLTWHALVKLYVAAGEVEKADAVLQKASQQRENQPRLVKPIYSSYIILLEQYAKRGDIHSAESIFHKMKQAGYTPSRPRPYQTLLDAYINAKLPAYGFTDRMRADNVFLTKTLANQLTHLDRFKKNQVFDLLD